MPCNSPVKISFSQERAKAHLTEPLPFSQHERQQARPVGADSSGHVGRPPARGTFQGAGISRQAAGRAPRGPETDGKGKHPRRAGHPLPRPAGKMNGLSRNERQVGCGGEERRRRRRRRKGDSLSAFRASSPVRTGKDGHAASRGTIQDRQPRRAACCM